MKIRIDHRHYHVVEFASPEVLKAILKLQQKVQEMDERLSREIQETRDAVTALQGRYQAKIDQMQTHIDELQSALADGNTAAANEAADALDALQTDLNSMAQETVAPGATEPVEPLPTGVEEAADPEPVATEEEPG